MAEGARALDARGFPRSKERGFQNPRHEKTPKEINYAHLERYSSERLMEEQKIYRAFVEEYPSRSFPDVLIRLVQTERKLREELSRRGIQVEKPRRITRATPRLPYE